MKSFLFSVLAAVFIFPTNSYAAAQRWVIHEDQPHGRVRVRVIEAQEANSLDQSVLAQDIILDQTMSATEFSKFNTVTARLRSFVSPRAGRPLWVAKQNFWTQADEEAYSAWFAQNATVDFMNGTGLKVDCSDTALTYRWVYAREHQLPIANTLSGTGHLFGHFSSNAAWDHLATSSDWRKDERFKAALTYLYNNSYSTTVLSDLAPTQINSTYVRPGSIFMIIRKGSGHTQSIKDVNLSEGLTTIWGNEPATAHIYETPIAIEFDQKETFGVWREARLSGTTWELTPATQTPGYSLEQFKHFDDEDSYVNWFESQLGIHVTDAVRLARSTKQINVSLGERLSVTADGIFECYYQTCSPDSGAYNDFSTFSRDGRLKTSQAKIISLVQQLGESNADVISWKNNLDASEIIVGTGLTLKNLILSPSLVAALNPDPRVSFAARWGLKSNDVNLDFFTSSEVILQLLYERVADVEGGQPSDALDANIRRALSVAQKDMAQVGFNATSFQKVFALFEQFKVTLDHGTATVNDVLWGVDGKSDIAARWSSSANASNDSRWGQ